MYAKCEGKKIETVSFVAFDSSFCGVALGKSVKNGQYKCFGGGFEPSSDWIGVTDGDENKAAINCGYREFEEETGISKEQFLFVEKTPFWKRQIKSRNAIHLFFIAVFKPDVGFPIMHIENDEMVEPRIIAFDDVLCSSVTKKQDGFQMNPFHLIAVCRAVQYMSKEIPICDETKDFFKLYHGLIGRGVHLRSYEKMIIDLLRYW